MRTEKKNLNNKLKSLGNKIQNNKKKKLSRRKKLMMASFLNHAEEDAVGVVAEVEEAKEANEVMVMVKVADEVAAVVVVVKISELKMNSKETVTMISLLKLSLNRQLSVTRRKTLFLMTKTTLRCDEVYTLKSALSSKRADRLAEGANRCHKLV